MFIIKYTNKFLVVAIIIFIVTIGIISIFKLNLGIDFTGGALTEVAYGERPQKEDVEQKLDELSSGINLGGYSLRATVDDSGKDGFILRTRSLEESERQNIKDVMLSVGTGAEISRFTSIGPVIGEELKGKALWAIVAVVLVIILFVTFAFRSVSKPVGSWMYGGITILALAHDVLVPTAVMSLLGYFAGVEADVLFIMALLAVLGYSVNDTIVVFDRVRENLLLNKERQRHEIFEVVVGRSVGQTITRSINTSVTTIFALGALYFLGGEVTQTFSLILIVGVIAGTYSSICIANPLLIYFGKRSIKREKKTKKK